MILDCRYPCEYLGGHIKHAINTYRKETTRNFLFGRFSDLPLDSKNNNTAPILIFHCEYSKVRGPSMAEYIRNVDRAIHARQNTKLFYPEIYILAEGYKKFFRQCPTYCIPNAYIRMKDVSFRDPRIPYNQITDNFSRLNSARTTDRLNSFANHENT
ncbi:hypothetical protein HZS_2831 [Henneguya salminicola]|nr:hypothetical protein HZS_2831 [Henneguya salminicola]